METCPTHVDMYHTTSFRSMNTDVAAWLWCDDASTARRALAAVQRTFAGAHARFTRFDAASELSALNASAGRPFSASPDLYEVVEWAMVFAGMTDGLFNPAIIGALEAAGYDRTFDVVKSGVEGGSYDLPSWPVTLPRIALDAERREITLPAGVRIDLGGIAKGWTVYRAARQLSAYGPCLVDAGGDMMTFGVAQGESAWRVGVADPLDARRDLVTLRLRDGAVATSGIDRRRWRRNGAMQHHLIDPRTGRPSTGDLISATLIAPTTIEAEVYAKTVFLLGSDAGMQFVEKRPALAALMVKRGGEMISSSRLEHFLDVHFVYDTAEYAAA